MTCSTCAQNRAIADRVAQPITQPKAAENEPRVTIRYYGTFTSPVAVFGGQFYFGLADGFREQEVPQSLAPAFVMGRGSNTPELALDPLRNGRMYLLVYHAEAEAMLSAGLLPDTEPLDAFLVPGAALEQRIPDSPAAEPELHVAETPIVDPDQPQIVEIVAPVISPVAEGVKAAKATRKKKGG